MGWLIGIIIGFVCILLYEASHPSEHNVWAGIIKDGGRKRIKDEGWKQRRLIADQYIMTSKERLRRARQHE